MPVEVLAPRSIRHIAALSLISMKAENRWHGGFTRLAGTVDHGYGKATAFLRKQ